MTGYNWRNLLISLEKHEKVLDESLVRVRDWIEFVKKELQENDGSADSPPLKLIEAHALKYYNLHKIPIKADDVLLSMALEFSTKSVWGKKRIGKAFLYLEAKFPDKWTGGEHKGVLTLKPLLNDKSSRETDGVIPIPAE